MSFHPLRTFWSYLFNRHLQGDDANARLQALYAIKDPWDLGSTKEQARFAWINQLVEGLPARPARLLEIGCGEGHQSVWLARTCTTLEGVDISELATARARERLPESRFSVTPWLKVEGRAHLLAGKGLFDLVTACEVLYYLSDVPAGLRALEGLGRTVLITNYADKAEYVMPYVRESVGAGLHEASFSTTDGTTWLAAWWTPPPRPAPPPAPSAAGTSPTAA